MIMKHAKEVLNYFSILSVNITFTFVNTSIKNIKLVTKFKIFPVKKIVKETIDDVI